MNLTVNMNPCFKEVDNSKKRYIVMKGSARQVQANQLIQRRIIY